MVDLSDSLLLRSLARRAVLRRPVWLMRQAGRYLPEYRALRKDAGGFLQMVKTPDLAAEITCQPIRRFNFDAAIIFSDILTIPDAMQLDLQFVEGEGPRINRPLQSEVAVAKLPPLSAEDFAYVFAACAAARKQLPADVPLIGFCGAPWTVACYMVDGRGGDFCTTRAMQRAHPKLLHRILSAEAEAAVILLIGQIQAGCSAVMIFDSWGGLLADDDYEAFSLQYIRQIIRRTKDACGENTPIIVYARACGLVLPQLAGCGAAAVGVDSQVSLATARRAVQDQVALQGNLDYAVLQAADPQTVYAETQRVLQSYGSGGGHIFNLGSGVNKTTPIENVSALVEAVRAFPLDTNDSDASGNA